MDYKCFIQRTCYLGLFHLSRSDLKKKVINSPDVNQVVREDVNVKDFVESFYNCDYKTFNQQLLNAHKRIW